MPFLPGGGGGGGPPAAHAPTHATINGSDPLTAAQVSHDHGGFAIYENPTLVFRDVFLAPPAKGAVVATIADNAASASATTQPAHARVLRVVFPNPWAGGNIILSSKGGNGQAQVEQFTSPGAGGGTVVGTMAHLTIDPGGITNDAPGGAGAQSASIEVDDGLGLSNKPAGQGLLVAVIRQSVDGVAETPASVDLAEGVVVPATVPNGARNYEITYQFSHTHGISSVQPTIDITG